MAQASVLKSYGPLQFPPEIIHGLLCHFEPGELPTIALISSSYKSEAERLLYRSIGVSQYRMGAERLSSCLTTLAKAPHKALLVRSFRVTLSYNAAMNPAVIQLICSALVEMKSLKHLHLCLHESGEEYFAQILDPVLKHCTFSLVTLSAPEELDLASWVPDQTELTVVQTYGLGFWELNENPYPMYRKLIQDHESPKAVYCLSKDSAYIDTLTAFPGFQSKPFEWSAEPIKNHLLSEGFYEPSSISIFKLFLLSLSDEKTMRQALSSISLHFPQVTYIVLLVHDPDIHVNPGTLSPILSLLPGLAMLDIQYWDLADGPKVYMDSRIDLATSWGRECPKLQRVGFPDLIFCTRNEIGPWNVSGRQDW